MVRKGSTVRVRQRASSVGRKISRKLEPPRLQGLYRESQNSARGGPLADQAPPIRVAKYAPEPGALALTRVRLLGAAPERRKAPRSLMGSGALALSGVWLGRLGLGGPAPYSASAGGAVSAVRSSLAGTMRPRGGAGGWSLRAAMASRAARWWVRPTAVRCPRPRAGRGFRTRPGTRRRARSPRPAAIFTCSSVVLALPFAPRTRRSAFWVWSASAATALAAAVLLAA